VVAIPDAIDFATAAAFPVAYGTLHFALTHRGHLQPSETLLVLGAAGGVGLTAVEIGKAMGACSSPRLAAWKNWQWRACGAQTSRSIEEKRESATGCVR
jgi:NADPH:quinone reductase-like Zn-dependent oxidoreductase